MTEATTVTKSAEDRSESHASGRTSKAWLILVGFVAIDFVLGAAAGVYAGAFFGSSGPAHESASDDSGGKGTAAEDTASEPKGTRTEVEVGRITVVLPADDANEGSIQLLITPLVVGYPEGVAETAEGDAPAGPTAELRDAYIEYLSQLHETEVRGSLGLATLRAELLRRARTMAPDLNASAVLIQEFLIQ